jgi:LIVCS family branched-chain amino acid:cation transporter
MSQNKSIFLYGFAIFAMFFGSGNLIFPITIGFESGNNWLIGFIGLLVTGIALPFLGLYVVKLYRGSYKCFFKEAGSLAGALIPFFMLSLIASFGVIPRCITVAHGGFAYIMPDLSLFSFALFFCIMSFFLCLKESLMVKVLGKFMSPLLLISLLLLIGLGIVNAPEINQEVSGSFAFKKGFLTGYQTMDLFGAFFFSSLIFKQAQDFLPEDTSDEQLIKFTLKSSIIGSSLIALMYLGLVYLGSHYAEILQNISPEFMLTAIVSNVMGKFASILLAIAIFLACITTVVAVNNIYARYICSILKLKNDKFIFVLFFTTTIAFIISLFNFKTIAAFLAPVLTVMYPGLIALTIMCIFTKKHKLFKTIVFWVATIGAWLISN